MKTICLAIASILVLGGCSPNTDDPNLSALVGLSADQKDFLAAWLKQYPTFRPPTDDDCNCDSDIKEMRQKGPWGHPLPNYKPYLKSGDFNQDGQGDFAIIAIEKSNPSKRKLLIFNGPFSGRPKPPTLSLEVSSFEVLFYDPPERPLVVGAFASEGCIIKPRGLRYVLDCDYGG